MKNALAITRHRKVAAIGYRARRTAERGLLLCGLALLLAQPGMAAAESEPPRNSDDLFTLTKVWTVHLTFTPDQWHAMEPQGGPGAFGPGRGERGPGRPGGPGRFGPPGGLPPRGMGPGGGPGQGAGFGPGMFIAPLVLTAGDADGDGQLTAREFTMLADKWFAAWDTNRSGGLSVEETRSGLDASAPAPGPAGGPGGPPEGLNLRGADGRRNGLAAALGIEFPTVMADLDFDGQKFPAVSVRYKGNGTFLQSRNTLKRSLKIDLNDAFPGRKLAGVTKLNLHNCVTDASWMNEVLSHRLFRDAGVPAPRTAYARVYLTVPGEFDRKYLGLYSLVENVDGPFLEHRFGNKRGVLFKPVTPNLFEYLGDDWAAYRQTYDPKTPPGTEEISRVITFAKLVSAADDATFADRLGSFLDLDEFARFMAVTVWLSTLDSLLGPGQNFLVHLEPTTRRFQFIPWDLDHSFGQFPLLGTQTQRENLSIHQPWQGERRFLQRVFAVPAFKERYLARLKELNETLGRPERIATQVDEVAAAIRPAVAEESARKLARFDQVVAGQPVGPEGPGGFMGGTRPRGRLAERNTGDRGDDLRSPGGPNRGFQPPRDFGGPPGGPMFGEPVKPIKSFVTARARSVADQLAGRSEGETLGGGFGPGGRPPGGPAGPPPGPGLFLGAPLHSALDADKDGTVTRAEFTTGMARWFSSWDTDQSGSLTVEQLRAGIEKDLLRLPAGFPGFGPPEGNFPPEP